MPLRVPELLSSLLLHARSKRMGRAFIRKPLFLACLTLLSLVILIVFSSIAAAVFLSAQQMLQTRTAVASAHGKTRELQALLHGVENAESGQRGFLLTRNTEYLDAYQTGIKDVAIRTAAVKRISLPETSRMLTIVGRKITELKMTVDLELQGRHTKAIAIVQSNRGLFLTRELYSIAAKHLRFLQEEADIASAENRHSVEEVRKTVASLSIVAALLVVLALYATWNQFRRWSSEAQSLRDNEILLEQRVVERTRALTTEVSRRSLAERALIQAQIRLDTAAAFSGVVTWTWEISAGTLIWQGPVEKVLGITPDKLEQRENFLSRICPDDLPHVKKRVEQALASGREYESEFRFMLPEGGVRWIAARGGVYFEDSRAVRMSGVNFDITARKEAELQSQASQATLQERESQIELVFQRLAVGNWTWNMAADRLTCHPIVWQQYGSAPLPAGAPASWFQERQYREDWPDIERALQAALNGDDKLDVEFRVVWPDGSLHWLACRGTVVRDEHGNPAFTHGLNFDITERKRMELQLKENELQFRHLANAIPQIAWTAHPNGSVYFYNDRWYELTGSPRGLEGNASWAPIVHPDDLQPCLKAWTDCVQSGVPFELELRFWDRKRDEYRWYLGRALPVRDETGTILRWFGTSTDIHEQKIANESLEVLVAARTEDLRRALLQKDILFKEVHHRVKNNLQVISSLLRMQGETLKGPAAKALKQSHDRVFSMALIHERLYSHPQVDQLDFVTYARTLVDELVFSYARSGNISSYFKTPSKIFLNVDQAIPCGLILNELVTNALKYAYPQGQGEVRITMVERAEGKVTLAVTDDGVGLPPGFKPGESKSLGIPIVTILAKQLGGALSINSERGLTFSVTFPRDDQRFAIDSAG